jgi:hypothetical protein
MGATSSLRNWKTISFRGDRVLLVWLLTVVAAQAVCLGIQVFCPDCNGAYFYFDPRFLLRLLNPVFGLQDDDFPVVSLAVALIIAGSAWAISCGRTVALIYFFFELLYGAAMLLFAVGVMIADMSPAHGFSPGELMFPLLVYPFASLMPGLGALRLYLGQHPENPRRVTSASGHRRDLKH